MDDKYKDVVGSYVHKKMDAFRYITRIIEIDEKGIMTLDCISVYAHFFEFRNDTDCAILTSGSFFSMDIDEFNECKINKSEYENALRQSIERIFKKSNIVM